MNLQLIKLGPKCKDSVYFEQINKEAFPPSEHVGIDDMFRLALYADTDILGIYDGDLPVGFTVLIRNAECGYVYFLAISKQYRSRGYGSAAIKKLFDTYSSLQIVLDFEEIREDAKNHDQRIRRKNFYLQNGFYETGRYTLMNGERFEVVCNAIPLNSESFFNLIHILHLHNPKFMDILM